MVGSISDCFKSAKSTGARKPYFVKGTLEKSTNVYRYPKKEVLGYVQLEIPELLKSREQNDYIVSYVESKFLVDRPVVCELKANRFHSEQARIRHLIDTFPTRLAAIKAFLETLKTLTMTAV